MFLKDNLEKVQLFDEVAVLSELLGRWFSRAPVQAITSSIPTQSDQVTQPPACSSSNNAEKYCYCQKEENANGGDLVGCDNDSCKYHWFHLTCLRLKTFRRSSKWYCPDCRKSIKNNSSSK